MNVDLLISAVYNKPAIWDKRSKLHSNRHYVDQCWLEVCKELNEDETKLKKKWKYLRDQFAVELGKTSTPHSGDGANTYGTKWPFFKSLLFLKDIVIARRPNGNLTAHLQNEPEATVLPRQDIESDVRSISPTEHFERFIVNEDNYDFNETSESFRSSVGMKRKRRNFNPFNEPTLAIEEQRLQYLKEISNKETKEADDEHLLFFKSLLPYVRKIPEHKQLSFRNQVQELVEHFIYHSQPHYSGSPSHHTTFYVPNPTQIPPEQDSYSTSPGT